MCSECSLYIWIASILLCVICLVTLVLVFIDFEKRFNMYICNAVTRSTLVRTRLDTLHDTILMMGAVFRPTYFSTFRKYIAHPDNSLQKDIQKELLDTSVCKGSDCCCKCAHHSVLNVRDNGTVWRVGCVCTICAHTDANTTYVHTQHGYCSKFCEKVIK